MEGSNSLINLGNISKPAEILIEKIAEAIGGIYKPYQIRRVAQAEADAEEIRAVSQIKITDLQQRAMQRFFIEEGKKQNNIESITSKALPLLEENSKPQDVEDDWITNYFDKCRLISDNEMQNIWSKILAGESNSPGKYSKRTIDLLSSMDKYDAELFSTLCRFSFEKAGLTPLIYNIKDSIYVDNGMSFSGLSHLESIGLIQCEFLSDYLSKGIEQILCVNYYNEPIYIEFPKTTDNHLIMGKVMLTQVGRQLANVCDPIPVDGFKSYLVEKWQSFGYKVSDNPIIIIDNVS